MALSDYQMSVDGVVLGAGTDYIVHGWDGLGVPTWRASDFPRPQDHGSYLGPDYLDSRLITIPVTVRGDSPAGVVANVDALIAAWSVDSTVDTQVVKPLHVKLPGHVERRLHGRPRRASVSTGRIIGGRADVTLEYFAADPRWYSADLKSLELQMTQAESGRGYDRSYNYGYGGGTSGVQVAANAGTFPTRLVAIFDGPAANMRLENITTGQHIAFNLELAAGQQLIVDFDARTVLLNGTASRYFAKSGDWWELAPGNNTVRFTADSAGTPKCTISWRDAWL